MWACISSPECLQDWVIMLLLKHWCMDTVEKIWICDELPNCPTVSAVLLCLTFTTGTRSRIKPAVFFLPPYFYTFLLAKNHQVPNDPWGQCRESLHIYCRVGAIIQWKSVSWHLQAPRVMPVYWLDVSVGCCEAYFLSVLPARRWRAHMSLAVSVAVGFRGSCMLHLLCELQDLEDGRVSESSFVSVRTGFSSWIRRWMDRWIDRWMDGFGLNRTGVEILT